MSGLGELTIAGSSTAVTAQTSYADSSFFDMFSFPLLSGSVEAWKASDRSAVISRSFADAHFPGRDPVGQTLTYNVMGLDEGYTFTIAAVMEDIDHSVIKYCDVMCRADFMTELNKANDEEMSNTGMFDTFIMTWPNSDIQAKIPEIRDYLGEVWWAYSENMVDKVFGADKGLILRQIASSYLLLSLIAFVVSVPVSWLLTDAWLSQFSYTAAPWLQWVLILASGVLSCAIAFLTILYQSIVAINTPPVIALRKED